MFSETRIMGRLTADPEMRQTQSGQKVANFTIACDREYKINGEKVTDYFTCVAWRSKAEFAEKYLRKGRLILFAGRFEVRKWEDKDGNRRISTELIISDYYFTGEPKRKQQEPPPPTDEDFKEMNEDDDELPF